LLREDRLAIGGEAAIAIALGKDAEDRDAVGDGGQVRIEVMVGTEAGPNGPEVVPAVGVVETQSFTGLFFNNAECTAESISGRTVTIRQGCGCG
jgi:hypothetical protein